MADAFLSGARLLCPQHYHIDFVGQLPTSDYVAIYKPDNLSGRLYKYCIGNMDVGQIADVVQTEVMHDGSVKYHFGEGWILWRAQFAHVASLGAPPSPPTLGAIPNHQHVRIILFPIE
jgi:hypothetical protein